MNDLNEATNTQPKHSYLGNAAGRKRRHILSKVMAKTSRSFFKTIQFAPAPIGLDLFCGQGQISHELSQIIGAPYTICGYDTDATSIDIAKEKIGQSNNQLAFSKIENDNWITNESYDFIYCRSFLNAEYTPLVLVQKMYDSLKPNGFVLLEHIERSNFQSFPQNYAFNRYLELQQSINNINGTSIDSIDQLHTILNKAQFHKIRIQQVAPTFLPDDCKQIASLSLEDISTQIIAKNLANPSELQALLYELKSLEKQKTTMISLPGVYQIIAYK